MSNDEKLQSELQAAAVRAGELVWPLPMHKFFDEQINSQVADIKNVGDGRWGGAITAAKFLERFVAGKPWFTWTSRDQPSPTNPNPTKMQGALPVCCDAHRVLEQVNPGSEPRQ